METIIVNLTPFEAESFKRFQKYHHLFSVLEETQALDIQFGKAIINFAFGEVQTVVKEEVVYKKP